MIGHGRPTAAAHRRMAAWRIVWRRASIVFVGSLVLWNTAPRLACAQSDSSPLPPPPQLPPPQSNAVAAADQSRAVGEARTVRVRLVWGSGAETPRPWRGSISITEGHFTDVSPLGIEADEAAAIRLVSGEIVVDPFLPRTFDGCDVTLVGASGPAGVASHLRIGLQTLSGNPPAPITIALAQLSDGPIRRPLDEFGGMLIVQRIPGDQLRVTVDAPSFVFAPGELVRMTVSPNDAMFETVQQEEFIGLDATVRRLDNAAVVWQASQSLPLQRGSSWPLAVPCPSVEGTYEVLFTANRPRSLSQRLLPGDAKSLLASHRIEMVVVDSRQPRPVLGVQWREELAVDPTISNWRQKVPDWAPLPRLASGARRALGNVSPVIRPRENGLGWVELPQRDAELEPSWLAYELPVSAPGQPYAVELELPGGRDQSLAFCFVEPDVAGRIATVGQTGGIDIDAQDSVDHDGVVHHRLSFWPRTTSVLLLICNRSAHQTAQFGRFRLLRRELSEVPRRAVATSQPKPVRTVTAYVAQPQLVDFLGASKRLDSTGDLAVEGWQTFLDGGTRFIQQLRADGFNSAILTVAADGSCLAPVDALGRSPRYDTQPLTGDGSDPLRKDVLELWFRLFDAEGLTLIPAIQLAAPLPVLESLRDNRSPAEKGIETIGDDGRSWTSRHRTLDGRAPHYNLLHPAVQRALRESILQLHGRYQHHPSLGGVALQLSGEGYGVLPGTRWGLDDTTMKSFGLATGIVVPGEGAGRFAQRADFLTRQVEAEDAWIQWRRDQVTKFYSSLAQQLSQLDPNSRLVLCIENALQGIEATGDVRRTLARRGSLLKSLDRVGLDLSTLSQQPGVVVPRPLLIRGKEDLTSSALDRRFTIGPEVDAALAGANTHAGSIFHRSHTLRLPSFDQQSPIGSSGTQLAFVAGSRPVEGQATQGLATAVARNDPMTLLIGADQGVLGLDARTTRFLQSYAQLPGPAAEVRTEVRQPITLRVYREAGTTIVAAINESRWPASLSITMESEEATHWTRLGNPPQQTLGDQQQEPNEITPTDLWSGSLGTGETHWNRSIGPYELVAWRFDTPRLRLFSTEAHNEPRALTALRARVAELESRMQNLDLQREYPMLQNPGFEMPGTGTTLMGWQPRAGQTGRVELDTTVNHSGQQSLRIVSAGSSGAAVESHSFDMPSTGQLLIKAWVKASEMSPTTRLYALLGVEHDSHQKRRYTLLGTEVPLGDSWTEQRFFVDDLPLAPSGKIRVQFLLVGPGTVWIDEVQLADVHFEASQRVELVKRLSAAKAALDEGKVLDCLELVDAYLPRYLVEYVPPAIDNTSVATRPGDSSFDAPLSQPISPGQPRNGAEDAPGDGARDGTGNQEQTPGFRGRIRQWVPRLWR